MKHPLAAPKSGYVAIYNRGPHGIAVNAAGPDAENLREVAHGDPTIVSMERAREVTQKYHDWEIPGY